jgi:two-component system sensor histidine kinase PilS (NtrC family)
MAATPLRRKLVVLMVVRLILSIVLLGCAVLIQLNDGYGTTAGPLYTLIGVTFGLSALYAATLGWAERRAWLVDLQLAADAVCVSVLIWITGGVTSYFSSLYVLPIIAASTLQLRRGAVVLALLSTALYSIVVVAQYLFVPGVSQIVALPAPRVAQYAVAINVVGFLAVGLLSGSLAERLRRADVRLADASTEIAALQAFNQHIIDSLTMGIVTADREGRILTFNRMAESITGVAAASALGQLVGDVLQLPVEFARGLEHRLRDPLDRRADYRFQTGAGRGLDFGISVAHLMTAAGPSGLLFTFQDVTATKKLERDGRIQQRLAAVG